MKYAILIVAILVLGGGLFLALHQPSADPDTRVSSGESDRGPRIVLAVHPYASPVELSRQFAPLLEDLGPCTGRAFCLSVSQTYETHLARVGNNEVELALLRPASSVTLSGRFDPQQLLCCFDENGPPGFHGHVVIDEEFAFALSRGEGGGSPMDLNIEHGEIGQPRKPMIRFATPVFDREGKTRGIMVLSDFGPKPSWKKLATDWTQYQITSLGHPVLERTVQRCAIKEKPA